MSDPGRPGPPVHLFVYGTLRKGEKAHRLLGGARLVATGSIAGILRDLGPYPGVERSRRRGARVSGDVYELGPGDAARRLAAIDRYEGRGFRRVRVVVALEDGGRVPAWAYVRARAAR